jgi:hypothetical protein
MPDLLREVAWMDIDENTRTRIHGRKCSSRAMKKIASSVILVKYILDDCAKYWLD